MRFAYVGTRRVRFAYVGTCRVRFAYVGMRAVRFAYVGTCRVRFAYVGTRRVRFAYVGTCRVRFAYVGTRRVRFAYVGTCRVRFVVYSPFKRQQPTFPWQIRHCSGAGSMKIRTASFYSRQAALRVRFRCKSECVASCFAFSRLRYTGSALRHSLSTLCVRAHHPFIHRPVSLQFLSLMHAPRKPGSVSLPSFLILLHTCSSPLHVTVLSL